MCQVRILEAQGPSAIIERVEREEGGMEGARRMEANFTDLSSLARGNKLAAASADSREQRETE